MKKLEDFQAEKVELKNVYGGKVMANTFSCNTATVGAGAPPTGDDGSDEADDCQYLLGSTQFMVFDESDTINFKLTFKNKQDEKIRRFPS